MLEEIDRSLERWLRDGLPLPSGSGDVHFDQPEKDWDGRRSTPLINLYLYSLHRSKRRATSGDRQLVALEGGRLARERLAPVVEARYLVSVWGGSAGVEHELLGRLVNLIAANDEIPEAHLGDTLRAVRPRPTIALEPDELVSVTSLWSGLDIPPRPSVQLLVYSPMGQPVVTAAADPPASVHLGFSRVTEPAAFAPRRRVLGRINGTTTRAPVKVTIEDSGRAPVGDDGSTIIEFPLTDDLGGGPRG